MSLETDDDDNNERDILYELFIYSEWVQEPELVVSWLTFIDEVNNDSSDTSSSSKFK